MRPMDELKMVRLILDSLEESLDFHQGQIRNFPLDEVPREHTAESIVRRVMVAREQLLMIKQYFEPSK